MKISWQVEELLASQAGLCPVELFNSEKTVECGNIKRK
jgi:hypothetical protein